MKLIIGGDLVPTVSNIDLFNNGDIIVLLGEELFSLWNSAEIRIFNLEVPLTDKESPIAKCGPNLIAPTSTIRGIKLLNPSLITLANNHILDQDEYGLKSTKNVLSSHEIPCVGAGQNLAEASKPYIIKKDKLKIGVYACTEHEFSIATQKTPGANPFDPLESLDHIHDLKKRCDYVIVLYHGGKEHYRYPSPYLQKVCKKMVDKGADLVLCQHSHCIGCYEQYKESTIVYGQGNFLFNKLDNEYWNTALLVKVILNNGVKIDYIPIVRETRGVRLATKEISEQILLAFNQRSEQILQEGFVEKEYKKFSQENVEHYLRHLSGFGKWFSRVDRYLLNGNLIKNKYTKEKLLAIRNFIECEAHRELLLKGIQLNN